MKFICLHLSVFFIHFFSELLVKVSGLKGPAYEVSPQEILETVLSFNANVKLVNFTVKKYPCSGPTEKNSSTDAFGILMKRQPQNLTPLNEHNSKNRLYNTVLQDLQTDAPVLTPSYSLKDGTATLQILTNALWYLDGRKDTIIKAHNVTPIPQRCVFLSAI